MTEGIQTIQVEEHDEATTLAMLANFAGLSDRDAFAQLFNNVVSIMNMMHRQRGHVTDEDLLERSTWAIEAAVGYKAPVELTVDDA
jgi:hypothetical protein